MECATIINTLDHGATIMIHKGWRKNAAKPKGVQPTHPAQTCFQVSDWSKKNHEQDAERKLDVPKHRSFQFVNTTKPNETRDSSKLQKTVRKYARKNRHEEWAKFNLPVRVPAQSHVELAKRSTVPLSNTLNCTQPIYSIPYPLGSETSLTTFTYPIIMSAQSHNLLSAYLTHVSTRMFPPFLVHALSHNPLRSPTWFRYAVHDEAMLCAMLYSAAVHLFLLTSPSLEVSPHSATSRDGRLTREKEAHMLFWQGKTLDIVSKRLDSMKNRGEVEDSTLGAISCLALGEAVLGNQELWHVHMRGLRHLVLEQSAKRAFGVPSAAVSVSVAISRLSPVMRTKLYRSDISGAIDYNLHPYLSFPTSTSPLHIWSFLPPSKLTSLSIQLSNIISPIIPPQLYPTSTLLKVLTQLVFFTHTLSLASTTTTNLDSTINFDLSHKITLDPHLFSSDLCFIQSGLLTPSTLLPPSSEDKVHSIQNTAQKALRLAALLYLKYILQEFPHSVAGSTVLLFKLKTTLEELHSHLCISSQPHHWPFQLSLTHEQGKAIMVVSHWAGAIGALVGKGETHRWFVELLALDRNLNLWKHMLSGNERAILFNSGAMKGAQQDDLETLLSFENVFGTSAVYRLWREVEVLALESPSRIVPVEGVAKD